MTVLPRTVFEKALAASGLVPHQAVCELQSVVDNGNGCAGTLADSLIEHGLLNPWQVDQLSRGRSKFSLGPYQIIDAIGRGGMGYVFKARHALLGRVEAIKVLPRERIRGEAIPSFLREIRAQAQLDHPNVVRVSYADQDGDTYYLVTEFVPGIDLRRLVRRAGPLPADAAAVIAIDVCQALEYGHRRGIVHRDIKPGNVLVTPEGRVKLTDLGLAWRLDDPPEARDDEDGRIVGTCDYLAPEAVQRPTNIMPVSDIYSLGCTLYYALTGKVPYPGGNAHDKLRRVVREEPLDPRAIRPSLPEEIVTLLNNLMHKDHHQRTPTAATASECLLPFINSSSRAAVADLVQRFQHRPAGGFGDGPDSDDTVDEPLPYDPLNNPFDYEAPVDRGSALQATESVASADQQTDDQQTGPIGKKRLQPDGQAARLAPDAIDRFVWATVIVSLLGAAALVVSALMRG